MDDTAVRRGSGPAAIPYVPAVIPPDPARDARVAARRAADAARAGRALDAMAPTPVRAVGAAWQDGYREGFDKGWSDGYAASDLHHNRHYGVPDDACSHGAAGGLCGRIECQVGDGDAWADAWPDGAV